VKGKTDARFPGYKDFRSPPLIVRANEASDGASCGVLMGRRRIFRLLLAIS